MSDPTPQPETTPQQDLHQKVVDFLNELGADIVALPVFVPKDDNTFGISTQVFVTEKKKEEAPAEPTVPKVDAKIDAHPEGGDFKAPEANKVTA